LVLSYPAGRAFFALQRIVAQKRLHGGALDATLKQMPKAACIGEVRHG
jgi:hypothetical protein